MRKEVRFQSNGLGCAGWLFIPDGLTEKQKAPAVVMGHGLSAVKEQGLEPFAQRFCEEGFATLVFDYRCLGESEGDPRCQHFPLDMAEDFKNAVTWLSTQPEVDAERIGLWGTSYGGGLAVHAGTFDPRVKAVVAQAPSVLSPSDRRDMNPEKWEQVGRFLSQDRVVRYKTGKVNCLKVVAPNDETCVLPGRESYENYMKLKQNAPTWRNQITLESLEKMREFDPVSSIHLMPPTALLMIPAEKDALLPFAVLKAAFDKAAEPKRLVSLPIGHFDIYEEPWRSQAIEHALAWYQEHL